MHKLPPLKRYLHTLTAAEATRLLPSLFLLLLLPLGVIVIHKATLPARPARSPQNLAPSTSSRPQIPQPATKTAAASPDAKASSSSSNDAGSGSSSSSSSSSDKSSCPTAPPAQPCKQRAVPYQHIMANDQPPVLVRPIALLFGDSLTERSFDPDGGWGAAMAHHFARKLDVVNRGFGGYNSRWGIKLLEQVLQQVQAAGQRVALMTLWFGANDAAMPGRSAERQHVPVEEYTSNLEHMVGMARQAGISRILLITPPPVGDEARIRHIQNRMGITSPVAPDRTLQYTQQYAAAVTALAAKLHLPCVDLFNKLQEVPDWRATLFDDGLHFTPAGARKVWEHVRGEIKNTYPDELKLNEMSNQFPWWDKWDPADPEGYWQATLPQLQANTAAAAAAAAAASSGKGSRNDVKQG